MDIFLQISVFTVGSRLTASVHRNDKTEKKRPKKTRYYDVTAASYRRISKIIYYNSFTCRAWLTEFGWDATKLIRKIEE